MGSGCDSFLVIVTASCKYFRIYITIFGLGLVWLYWTVCMYVWITWRDCMSAAKYVSQTPSMIVTGFYLHFSTLQPHLTGGIGGAGTTRPDVHSRCPGVADCRTPSPKARLPGDLPDCWELAVLNSQYGRCLINYFHRFLDLNNRYRSYEIKTLALMLDYNSTSNYSWM
jgi:hypothetical protein